MQMSFFLIKIISAVVDFTITKVNFFIFKDRGISSFEG